VTPAEDKQLLGRVAAAIWASIGTVGFVATVGPLRTAGAHVTEMRAMAAAAALIAGIMLAIPAAGSSRKLQYLLSILMTAFISVLAFAAGPVRGDLTMLFIFVVAFTAYFFPWQASLGYVGLIAALLASRLFLVTETDAMRVETIRMAILVPAFMSVWGLVSLLRKSLLDRDERLQAQEIYDHETGILSKSGLRRTLDAEAARAVRHARPLALVYLRVEGPALAQADFETASRVATVVARAMVGRIRAEDHAARLEKFKFAVLAGETGDSGARALALGLADYVRKRLLSLGYENESFSVRVGWAELRRDEEAKEKLFREADRVLDGRVLMGDGVPVPSRTASAPPPTALASS
jgi:GGDEF domain-containing protein